MEQTQAAAETKTGFMTYQQLKKKHSDELNNFQGLFFAFSMEQLKEGFNKLGLNFETDKIKIVSIGHGGYMLRDKVKDFSAMMRNHEEEIKGLRKNNKELLEALIYELNNHEFCYTGDPTQALNALGLKESEIDPAILKKAIKAAYRE